MPGLPHLLIRLEVAMLYVEEDLAAVSKAVFDQWDVKKDQINHKILYCADARVSAGDIIECIERRMAPSPSPTPLFYIASGS